MRGFTDPLQPSALVATSPTIPLPEIDGGGATCLGMSATSSRRSAFERTSKRRRGFPSETHVKRGDRVVHGDKELLPPRSSVGRIHAHADLAAGSARAACAATAF